MVNKKVKKFVMVTHFTGLSAKENFVYYPFYSFLSRLIPLPWLKNIIPYIPAHEIVSIRNITSDTGKTVNGYAVMCSLLPEHFFCLKENFVLSKVISACRMAKFLGADVVGLAAFTSVVGNEGEAVSKNVNISVTSGNTYTAVLAIDSILNAVQTLNIDPKKSTLVVLGATGDIGSICTKVLVTHFGKTILVARNRAKLEEFTRELPSGFLPEVEQDPDVAVAKGNVILCVASSVLPIVNIATLQPGSIFCDVSIPPAIVKKPENFRKDVLVYDGGKALVPNQRKIKSTKWHKLFPQNIIFGCLGETILLTLEGNLKNYSLGRGNITPEKIEEMREIARKNGFATAPFFFGEYFYNEADFKFLRTLIKERNFSKTN